MVIDDDDGMMDAFAGAAAGAGRIDGVGAGVVAGAAGGAGMGAGEGIRSEAVDAGMDDAAGAAAGEDAVAEVADVVPLLAGAGADSAAGAGMDAEDVAGAAGGDAAGFDEVSAMQQLCDLLRRPLADGKSKFSHRSPSFQEWVCALLDCWKCEDGAWMRKHLCVRAFSDWPLCLGQLRLRYLIPLMDWSPGALLRRKTKMTACYRQVGKFFPVSSLFDPLACHAWLARVCAPHLRGIYPRPH